MLTIIWRNILDRKIALASFILANLVFLWMFVAVFPELQAQAADFEQLLEAYPEGLLDAFGIETVAFDNIELFLSFEHYSIIWPLITAFFVLSLAGKGLAGEVETGTAELLLAKPVSRLTWFFSRYGTGVLLILIYTFLSTAGVVPLAAAYGLEVDVLKNFYVSILGVAFALAVYSMGMMFSAMVSEKSRAYMFGGGILLLMYLFAVASRLVEAAENLQYASFFYYFDVNVPLVDGRLEALPFYIFGGVIVVTTIIGAIWWHKRDIAV